MPPTFSAVTHCWIELGSTRAPDLDERAHDLRAGGRELGRLFVGSANRVDPAVAGRVLNVLSSLLAAAIEREEVTRSDTAKTAVLRAVSHDLRSPLTAIGTAGEMLADPTESLSAADREELLSSIRSQARRLDRLVGNLLDLSRLEARAARPVAELWTVDSLVALALDAIGRDGDRVAVSVPSDCPPCAWTLRTSSVRSPTWSRTRLRTRRRPIRSRSRRRAIAGEVVIRVADHGPGIAPRRARRDLRALLPARAAARAAPGSGSRSRAGSPS